MSTRRDARVAVPTAQTRSRLHEVLTAGLNRSASIGIPPDGRGGGEAMDTSDSGPTRAQLFRCETFLVPASQLQMVPALLQSINALPRDRPRPRVSGEDGLSGQEDDGDLLFVIAVSHCPDVNQRVSTLTYCEEKIRASLLGRTQARSENFWTGQGAASVISQCAPHLSTNYYYYFTTNDQQKNNLRVLLFREDESNIQVNGVQHFMLKTFGDVGAEVTLNAGMRSVLTYKTTFTYEDLSRFPRRRFRLGTQGKDKDWSIHTLNDFKLVKTERKGDDGSQSKARGKRPASADSRDNRSKRIVQEVVAMDSDSDDDD